MAFQRRGGRCRGGLELPGASLEEAAAEAAEAGGATYGKLILLGDPESFGDLPMGQPQVIFPTGPEPGTPTP